MHENIRENISDVQLGYTTISLISPKVKVLVVGGGKVGFLKAKSFFKRGARVTVVSETFVQEFKIFEQEENLTILKGSYETKYILDQHIVIIATDCEAVNEEIIQDCEKNYKLYLACHDFKKGLFLLPYQVEGKNISFSVHTRAGSPRSAMFLGGKISENLEKYENFIEYHCRLREKCKKSEKKNEIMRFVSNDDFYFFYNKGAQNLILKMFYGGIDFGFENCVTKK